MLRILHPLVADRDCGHCRTYHYNEETGLVQRTRITKELIKRGADEVLPCDKGLCPKGHWTDQRSLSPKNVAAYHYHTRCKLTGKWVDDEVVLDNATLIELAEQQALQFQQWQHHKNVEGRLATIESLLLPRG